MTFCREAIRDQKGSPLIVDGVWRMALGSHQGCRNAMAEEESNVRPGMARLDCLGLPGVPIGCNGGMRPGKVKKRSGPIRMIRR
jgi:hypothetical protein